jgi:hypothetical protein
MRPAVPNALLAIAAVLTVSAPFALVQAGPPPATEPTESTEPAEPAQDVPAAASFWLSLELVGPRGAQIDAARALLEPPVVDALPRGGAPPPGELVGRVDSLEQALRWVAHHAFDGGAFDGDGSVAPLPGGAMLRDHGVHLTALVVTGAGPSGGTLPYPWPPAAALSTPSAWQPASLTVNRAPAFAAPSPRLPPASERYAEVGVADSLWQLGVLERCSSAGECLRWAQILVRQGDRFFGAWIPAGLIVAEHEWVAGPNERRFALLASHRDRASLGYVLVELRGDRARSGAGEAPRGITHPHADSTWPSATLALLGQQLLALIDGEPKLTLELVTTPTPQLR